MRASCYSSLLNAKLVVAFTCTLALNVIRQTSYFFGY